MSCNKPFEIRVGDTIVPLTGELTHRNESGVIEAANLADMTVVFSMLNSATGEVVIDQAVAMIDDEDNGIVSYDFAELEVVTPGVYWGTFRVQDGAEVASYPVNPKQCVVWIHGNGLDAEEAYEAAR